MTWRAALSLPPEAGAQLEQIGKEMGVAPAVAARILLLEKLREWAVQDRQTQRFKPWNLVIDPPETASAPKQSTGTEAGTEVGQ